MRPKFEKDPTELDEIRRHLADHSPIDPDTWQELYYRRNWLESHQALQEPPDFEDDQ